MPKQQAKGFDDFFHNKTNFKIAFRPTNPMVLGNTATVRLSATYSYVDAKSGEAMKFTVGYDGELEKTGERWVWKKLQ